MKKTITIWRMFAREIRECHISAYASSAAFFMFLSLIPMLLLVCAILPYTPVTEANLMEMIAAVVPTAIMPLAVNTVVEVYDKSPAIISISALATIWTAGKGMLAIIRGLNSIHKSNLKQNYFIQRLRASVYTIILVLMILISLLLGVFGESIGATLMKSFPDLAVFGPLFSNLRILLMLALLMLFFTALFTWIPNEKLDWKTQVIGACFTSIAWSGFSFVFSVYVNDYGKNSVYGSMYTIAIMMFWFYFLFYIMFLGALLSRFLEPATVFLIHKRVEKEGNLLDRKA